MTAGASPVQAIKASTRIAALALDFGGALLTCIIIVTIRRFADLFAGFGAELPWITAFFVKADVWLLLLPLAGLIPTVLLFNKDERPIGEIDRMFVAVVVAEASTVLLLFLAVWAMYAPIFKLGAVVR